MSFFDNKRQILSICTFFIFIISATILLKILLLNSFLDFENYYLAVDAFVHGNNPFNSGYFGFPYSPAALLFFIPFTFLPLLIASKLFVFISFICLFVAVYLLLKIFHTPIRSLLGMTVGILVFNFFPVKWSLAMGQINTVILLLLALFIYWYINKRAYLAGVALAFALVLKFYPFLLIPYLIIEKQWKILAAIIVTLVGISVIVFVTIPSSFIIYYFSNTLSSQLHAGGGMYYFDQSLSAFVSRVLHNPMSADIARVLSGIIVLFAFYIIWLRRRITDVRLLNVSVLLILNLILNNFNWQHHFIWLLIPLIITLFYIRKNKLSYRYYFLLGISYLLMAANIKFPSTVAVVLQSHVFYGAILLLILDFYLILKTKRS